MNAPRATLLDDERTALERAVSNRSVDSIVQTVGEIELRLFPEGSFDAELIALLAELLSRADVFAIPNSYRAFLEVTSEFHELTPSQGDFLVPFVEYAMCHTDDFMMAFEMSCGLGEYFHTQKSLDALVRLKTTARNESRSLVPHGLEHIAKGATEKQVRDSALRELRSMATDPHPDVRNEVAISLARLGFS